MSFTMSLVFAGKTLSCIAATGTMGAVATIPKIKSTLVSVEKDILHFSPNPLEEKVFQQLVDVSDFQTTQENQKKENVKETIKKIVEWLKTNGGCSVSLAISATEKNYLKIVEGRKETENNKPIFAPQKNMNGKSKFERLVEDLTDENSRNGSDKDKYKKYRDDFKKKCSENSNKVLRLQWRGQIFQETAIHSKDLEGLINLWVIEKTNTKV